MAGADYFGIEESLAATLAEDSAVAEYHPEIVVERQHVLGKRPSILVFLDRRDAPPERQTLAAGTRTRFELQLSLWVYAWGLKLDAAAKERDELIGQVELALMRSRNLGRSDIQGLWLVGGEFDVAHNSDASFHVGGEVGVHLDVTAVT